MNEGVQETGAAVAAARHAGKYLTFSLADEEYGVEILKVQEIIRMLPITRVPRTPAFVRGVINLRGRVIPVVDLRSKLGMDPLDGGPEQCMIVIQVMDVQTALIVDRVSEVLDIAPDAIEDPPHLGADGSTEFLLGIAKTAGRVQLLLDIDQVLSEQEVVLLQITRSELEADAD